MNMEELGIIPTLFYPLGSDEQGISANMQKAKDLTHRDSILWHTIHNYASWHIWKARCSAEFKQEEPSSFQTAFAALLDFRRAAVNQISDLHHWDRWWAVRPELNFLDKSSLLSDEAWYKSMLSERELSLIPKKGLSFVNNEWDSLTTVTSYVYSRYCSGTCTSLKRRASQAFEGANLHVDPTDEDEIPLRRNIKRRRIVSTTSTIQLIRSDPGDESGTTVDS
jgi:hypothetical protein